MILRSVETIARVIPPGDRVLVGIAGAPGAGKSTLAADLARYLPSAVVLPMDGFHFPPQRLVELGWRDRMGAPETFDVDAFTTTLAAVRNSGRMVRAPGFDRENERPVPAAIAIPPELSTVVVEGNYLLLESDGWAGVRDLLDVTLFVEIDETLRRQRLIDRHVRHGKTPWAARQWAEGSDERNAQLVRTSASRADHIVRLLRP